MACAAVRPQPDDDDRNEPTALTPDQARDYMFWAGDALSDEAVVRLARAIQAWIRTQDHLRALVPTGTLAVLFLA